MDRIRVSLIGKRVADAVRLQDDMVLADVVDIVSDYRLQVAGRARLPVYTATPQAEGPMRVANIVVAGGLADLLANSDVVVDCTPKKVAAVNKGVYEATSVKSIFHRGESHALTGHSFVTQANYELALRRSATRVMSCSTTSLIRPAQACAGHVDPARLRPLGDTFRRRRHHRGLGEGCLKPPGGCPHRHPRPRCRENRGEGGAQLQPPAHMVDRADQACDVRCWAR